MFDIFKILIKKSKLIAWVTLMALILGAAAGAVLAIISNATYGSKVEFYISSEEANNYILSLLRSDSFAERLWLDENGLPENKKGTTPYNDAVQAKTNLELKIQEIEELEQSIKLAPARIAQAQRAYNDAQTNYTTLYNQWNTYMTVYIGDEKTYADEIVRLGKLIDGIAGNELNSETPDAKIVWETAKAVYNAELDKNQANEEALLIAQEELADLSDAKTRAYDKVLADFRNDEETIKKIQDTKKAVTYEYEETDAEKPNESKSHLYVSIAVKFDKEFAQTLLNRISKTLSSFVEESVIAKGEEQDTDCVLLSVIGAIDTVDYKNPLKESLKFGAIAMAIALVIICFGVIIADVLRISGVKELPTPAEHPVLDEESEKKEEQSEEN